MTTTAARQIENDAYATFADLRDAYNTASDAGAVTPEMGEALDAAEAAYEDALNARRESASQ